MPSLEQSSTRMICLRIGTARTLAEDLADRVRFVVDRDDDRQDQVLGNAVDAQLAANGSPRVRDQPFPCARDRWRIWELWLARRGAVRFGQSRLVGRSSDSGNDE